jgi:hypothetical protein
LEHQIRIADRGSSSGNIGLLKNGGVPNRVLLGDLVVPKGLAAKNSTRKQNKANKCRDCPINHPSAHIIPLSGSKAKGDSLSKVNAPEFQPCRPEMVLTMNRQPLHRFHQPLILLTVTGNRKPQQPLVGQAKQNSVTHFGNGKHTVIGTAVHRFSLSGVAPDDDTVAVDLHLALFIRSAQQIKHASAFVKIFPFPDLIDLPTVFLAYP